MATFESGLENFLKRGYKKYQKTRLALLCNQASVDKKLNHASQLLTDSSLKLKLTRFFGPQHGIRGEKQDNMVESRDFIDPTTKKPVTSLYSHTRTPPDETMKDWDVLLVDLQDIGTRIYTFMYTMANCMGTAKRNGKKIVVLDRPNPIDGVTLEGNVLEWDQTSFVGQFPMPTRHGMTMGELAQLFNEEYEIGCDLEIIPLRNWDRKKYVDHYLPHWVPPSPNIPLIEAAITFPGLVHFEGTMVSEGRGTTRPLEVAGAPFIQPDKLAKELNKKKLPGVYFRAIFFQPMFQKWKDQVCGGVQLHVVDRKKFNSFEAGIHTLATIAKMYPDQFEWKSPPYEYEHDRPPIDLIAGSKVLREMIDRGKPIQKFLDQGKKESAEFKKIRKKYLLYK